MRSEIIILLLIIAGVFVLGVAISIAVQDSTTTTTTTNGSTTTINNINQTIINGTADGLQNNSDAILNQLNLTDNVSMNAEIIAPSGSIGFVLK